MGFQIKVLYTRALELKYITVKNKFESKQPVSIIYWKSSHLWSSEGKYDTQASSLMSRKNKYIFFISFCDFIFVSLSL